MSPGRRQKYVKTGLKMGTIVRLQVVTASATDVANDAMDRAFAAMQFVEDVCSRFDEESELSRLCRTVGQVVPVSELLFRALSFAWEVADFTDGRFDPTVGRKLEALGFNRHYLTGAQLDSRPDSTQCETVSYRDVQLNQENRSVCLQKSMRIDLGAVAKGLAVDLAAKELHGFEGFVVDAGGDVYVSGVDENGLDWEISIQHPKRQDRTICSFRMTDVAVCTSGSYARRSPIHVGQHHIIDAHSKQSPTSLLSCTAIGPFAMMADAFSTASFLLGAKEGLELLQRVELEGILITDELNLLTTPDMAKYLDL